MAGYAGAFVMRDGLLKFGSTDFTAQVDRVRLVPETPTQTWRSLVPDGVATDVDSAAWTLELQGVQDHESGGLADYLYDNAGDLVTFEVAPVRGSGKVKFTGSARAVAVPFGGDRGEFATFEVSLQVDGAPTKTTQS